MTKQFKPYHNDIVLGDESIEQLVHWLKGLEAILYSDRSPEIKTLMDNIDYTIDAMQNAQSELIDWADDQGLRDKSPEQLAGEAMQDKIDMYRNEY